MILEMDDFLCYIVFGKLLFWRKYENITSYLLRALRQSAH